MVLTESLGIFLLIIGIVLFAIELAHPGALLLIPATIVLSVGIILLLGAQSLFLTPYGPAIVITAGILAGIATIPYYRWVAPVHRPMSTIPSSLEGEIGIVVSTVIPDTLRGKVRVKSEVWSARSERPIPEGTKVKVLGGEGVSIRVVPLVDSPAAAEGS